MPLVEVRGEWVLLDREHLEQARRILDRRPGGRTTLGELLRLAGGLDPERARDALIDGVAGEGWLARLLDPDVARREIGAFTAAARRSRARCVRTRCAASRWLRFLLSRGLGACLADDMGLGKTIQFLATLLTAREAGERIGPSLLVCPTSVAENWVSRGRALRAVAARRRPPRRRAARAARRSATSSRTSTSSSRRTRSCTATARSCPSVTWEYLALDEAQNVKNPAAAQSRAVRGLRAARRRAALTGTPVENRLAELKSIFDFLNPGLLGTDESFRRHFVAPDRAAAASRPRPRAPAPRHGAVPPPPREDGPRRRPRPAREDRDEGVRRASRASRRRSTARRRARSSRESAARTGGARKAKILLLLLRLKQICDHPALFLGDGRLDGRSAKIARLLEMCEETLAEKSPSLLFTQFAEMGHLLVAALKERFGCEVLFLHGGVPRRARDEMVRRFQEDDDPPPFFVLSLRAGGTGLNLTRASHVFHVDRWWNPAVEEQATDRAFRIGQTQHVQVHKFVCRGTLEERIDRMIEDKKAPRALDRRRRRAVDRRPLGRAARRARRARRDTPSTEEATDAAPPQGPPPAREAARERVGVPLPRAPRLASAGTRRSWTGARSPSRAP